MSPELQDIIERSKRDDAVIVGSEIRMLGMEITRLEGLLQSSEDARRSALESQLPVHPEPGESFLWTRKEILAAYQRAMQHVFQAFKKG